MPKTQVTSDSITDLAVTEGKIANCAVAEAKIGSNAVTSAKINDGTVAAADLASSLDLSSKTVTLPPSATAVVDQNIALLGFKMAVNDGLTVFNLVDGVVDEFHDESGTDESEGSNDTYCATSDYYHNVTFTPVSVSAGFAVSSITEPDTSTAGTNPAQGTGTQGEFTVPTGMTSLTMYVWGAGGGSGGTVLIPAEMLNDPRFDWGPSDGEDGDQGGGTGTNFVNGGGVDMITMENH